MAESSKVELPEYIHGVLEGTIFQANHLHHDIAGVILQGMEKLIKALGLHVIPHSELYATIDIGHARLARTKEVEFQPHNPTWNQSFKAYCCYLTNNTSFITVSVKQKHPEKEIGYASIPISSVLNDSKPLPRWFDLFRGESKLHYAGIHLLLKFTPVESDLSWNAGILPRFSGVPNTYFPMRTGCNVTLYQNTHLTNQFQPVIPLSDGKRYSPPRLWEDLYRAILEAKHFIYVAGWSVNIATTLIRDPQRMVPGAESVTFGQLLKKKADQGVRVLVMIWQDRTEILGNGGLMKTNGDDTYKFFANTKVKCFLCPRLANHDQTLFQKTEIEVEFTHHQKSVTVDAYTARHSNNGQRSVVSFIGGVDICGGRYDDENHTLFQNLDTYYLHDFYQGNFPHADLHHGGPREPWHDAHSKLEGLAAWDVLTNFQQRWVKQAPSEISKPIGDKHDTFPHPNITPSTNSWNVQVFRSIDSMSVAGFPTDPTDVMKYGLNYTKDGITDQSIQSGYIEAIRRAKRFIYIENQYFFGSCESWSQDQNSGCSNLIPIEIAMKVASKIRSGERFAVYVLTPMWPEGKPEDETVQTMIHWNTLTIDMMYRIIAKAIEDVGLTGKTHPRDYLNFFCLGNREEERPGEYNPPEKPNIGTDYYRAQTHRRFLIYVHAKLMIVDDEYIIVGSANLNQRSLDGSRDTEIAQGSYQPEHLNALTGSRAQGSVHAYRMSLWYEHFMNRLEDDSSKVFLEPESIECVMAVRSIAEKLWDAYVAESTVDLPGHLLPFPSMMVSEHSIGSLFPDTEASVKGKRSDILPSILTT